MIWLFAVPVVYFVGLAVAIGIGAAWYKRDPSFPVMLVACAWPISLCVLFFYVIARIADALFDRLLK